MKRFLKILGLTLFGAMLPMLMAPSGGIPSTLTLQKIIGNGGATAGTSLIQPRADQTLYSILGRTAAGPGLQCRWDSATGNRFCDFGTYDNVGTFTAVFRPTAVARGTISPNGASCATSGGSIASCSNTGTGIYSVTLAGNFSAQPICVVSVINPSTTPVVVFGPSSATTGILNTYTSAFALANSTSSYSIICMNP